jgi:hypothetical protein
MHSIPYFIQQRKCHAVGVASVHSKQITALVPNNTITFGFIFGWLATVTEVFMAFLSPRKMLG